jgi:hypothetical protein
MRSLIPAITILALTLLFRYWPAIRDLARFKGRAAMLRDNGFGYAQVSLPPRWRPTARLNDQAMLQATDPILSRHVIVLSEPRDDFEPSLKLEEHAAMTLETLAASVQVIQVRGPDRRDVDGVPAIQYELEAYHDRARLKYLHTTIAGNRAFHQVLGWAPRSKYNRAAFEQLLDGFEELPGTTGDPADSPMMYEGPDQSRYGVH